MRKHIFFWEIMIWSIFLFNHCLAQDDFPILKGPYLGQKLPGMTPKIFAPGFICTGMEEIASTFYPDGKEFYYTVNLNGLGAIVMTKIVNDQWSAPEVASFSGKYLDSDPFVQPDGLKFFFISNRPLDNNSTLSESHNMWVMEREGNRWSEPKPVGPPINGNGNLSGPSVTRTGVIYFSRTLKDGWSGIFRSKYLNGKYGEPEKLPEAVNSTTAQFHACISPDESFLIVSVVGRKDSIGSTDYYVTFRNNLDEWSNLVNLGDTVNTSKPEFSPALSPDGKYFFFQSFTKRFKYFEKSLKYSEIKNMFNNPGNGNCDIYWVDIQVITNLKPKENEKNN